MDETNPTARALRCLALLQEQPGISASRLAAGLEVSERAARRYVAVLREAGVPVESVRGPYGGYRLGRGVRLPPLLFDPAEALGLVMAVLDGHHDPDDPADPVGSALGKLLRALPQPVAAQADVLRRGASAAPDRAAARPDPATAADLVAAAAQRRVVALDYCSEAGNRWTAEVEPWAVVVRHARWYLLCRSPARDAVRAYRVDRIEAVEHRAGSFVPPPDLDPVALLEQHLASGWEYAAEVVVEAPLETVARRLRPGLGRLEAVDEHTTRLVGSTSNPWWYAEQLVVLPAAYRILGGPELLHCARATGERLLAATAPADPPQTR